MDGEKIKLTTDEKIEMLVRVCKLQKDISQSLDDDLMKALTRIETLEATVARLQRGDK